MDFLNTIANEILGKNGLSLLKEKLAEYSVSVLIGSVFCYLFLLIMATKLILCTTFLVLLSLFIVNKVTGGILK